MMIKITEHCSMGCIHCMNNATPNNKHMTLDVFKEALEFQRKYGGPFCIITGGEPTEHPLFTYFLRMAMTELPNCFVTITTNGLWMQDNKDFVINMNGMYGNRLTFQVTNDKRYYPIGIHLNDSVFQLDNVVVCDSIESIYPQGRAVDNNIEWESKASKCFNIRAILKQILVKDLRNAIAMLAVKGKFCTPHIDIYGNIKLGESDLCPICSNIIKSHDEIVNDILNFKCNKCDHINCNLSEEYKSIIGED